MSIIQTINETGEHDAAHAAGHELHDEERVGDVAAARRVAAARHAVRLARHNVYSVSRLS